MTDLVKHLRRIADDLQVSGLCQKAKEIRAIATLLTKHNEETQPNST